MHLQTIQQGVLVAFSFDIIEYDEAILLYEMYKNSNPNFPYWEYDRFNLDYNYV